MAALPSQKAPVTAGPAKAAAGKAAGSQGKSGLIVLEPGQDLFKENDNADCLYILQKGQIRLYKPKGKGFVELAILRAGEVLGEMAYFGDAADSKRSCSASAISKVEIIAISFSAFGKAIENLNPWFKTIITTLVSRLRKTNARVKELESNSVSSIGGSSATYDFLKDSEIARILSLLYLVGKAHGTQPDPKQPLTVDKKFFKLYANEVFAMQEAKYEEFFQFLEVQKIIGLANDADNIPNIILIPVIAKLHTLFTFVNTQRGMKDENKYTMSPKCELFMDTIVQEMKAKEMKGPQCSITLNPILSFFKERNIPMTLGDLEEAKKIKLTGEMVAGSGGMMTVDVNKERVDLHFNNIKFQNALKKWNERKSK